MTPHRPAIRAQWARCGQILSSGSGALARYKGITQDRLAANVMNTSDYGVAFRPSTDPEMCYQFAFAYPAGALENGVLSLVGATNTCW